MKRRLACGAVCLAAAVVTASPSSVVRAQGNGIVASVTAGYQATYLADHRTIEFTAQRDRDNESRGQGHLFNHITGTKLHFTIDCLHVVGNVATVSGTFTHSNTSVYPEGAFFWVQVVDNGEGKKSPKDLVSPLFAIFGSPVACTTPVQPASTPIEGGNIQVRP